MGTSLTAPDRISLILWAVCGAALLLAALTDDPARYMPCPAGHYVPSRVRIIGGEPIPTDYTCVR